MKGQCADFPPRLMRLGTSAGVASGLRQLLGTTEDDAAALHEQYFNRYRSTDSL